MQFDIITIFPGTVEAMFAESIIGKARDKGLVTINVHDLRKYTSDNRNTVDDKPFGGGPGMLMMVEPIYKALKDLGAYPKTETSPYVILTSASGQTWSQQQAQDYSTSHERIIIICGHYEGVDQRVSEHLVDAEVSIGNYVLTGGELAAGVIVDSISRLIAGVVGNQDSLLEESHSPTTPSEYPQFTRPAEFVTEEGEKWGVPDVLLSGNHQEIKNWKQQNLKS